MWHKVAKYLSDYPVQLTGTAFFVFILATYHFGGSLSKIFCRMFGTSGNFRYFFRKSIETRRFVSTLKIDKSKKGLVTVTLNRPNKKNAFNVKMYLELQEALNAAGKDDSCRVLLLTGEGDFYSSGNDLSNFSRLMHPLKLAADSRELLRKFVESFILFPKPLVCAVNGPAIGIAVTTLGLCDRVFASSNASFRTPFADLAQAPEGCSSYLFPLIMGEKLANEVLWEGKKLSATEALSSGLVHNVQNPESLLPAAVSYCEELLSLPSNSIQLQRNIIRENLVEKLISVNIEECNILEKKWISKPCFNALAKFLESRNMRMQAAILR